MKLLSHPLNAASIAALAALLLAATGCKKEQPVPTDQQIAADVQAKLKAEPALAGQGIQVAVSGGMATLSGAVTDTTARTLAASDAGSVAGVKTVVDNLTVQPAAAPVAQIAAPASATPQPAQRPEREVSSRSGRAHKQQAEAVPPPPSPAIPPPAVHPVSAPPPPPPPPRPVVREITLAAGTIVPVRLTETLDSKTAQPNDVFHGAIAGDLGTQGVIAIPHGTAVMGRIVDAKDAAHFKGSALLSIELTQATIRGEKLTLVTDSYSKQGEGRGKNTVEKTGGGAALGAIIGAIAGGGKGAAIGGLAGAAAGTGVNAATRGQQVVIPTETLINFRLQSPITLKVTIPPAGNEPSDETSDPQLKHH